MKEKKKIYWKGLEELSGDPDYIKSRENEFPEKLPVRDDHGSGGWERRDFLKMMGFSIAAASLASCEAPVRKAIPYLNKPEEVDPGIPNYYASTYQNGGDYCSIVVKTREGRPIKIKGNKLSKISAGGVNAQIEASVLSLYDEERLKGPIAAGNEAKWEEIDSQIKNKLSSISSTGGQIRIVSNTVLSPSTKSAIEVFKNKYPGTEHITYDPVSAYGIVKANNDSFGAAVIPSYDFSAAQVVVSFGADFLGTWLSPVEFASQYAKNRKLGPDRKEMSRHYQFETNMSLTGANADYRSRIKPSEHGLAVASLYNLVAAKAGAARANVPTIEIPFLNKAADQLWANRGKSLVVSGSNDPNVQILVNAINDLLGNYGRTLDLSTPSYYRQGNDEAMTSFVNDLKEGRIGAVIFYNCNPVYDHQSGKDIADNISKAGLKVSTSDRKDETSSHADFITPDHHFLESWNDAEPRKGHFSLTQPAINPLFNTRQAPESFLIWAENDVTDYYNYLQNNFRTRFYEGKAVNRNFQTFWDKALYDGVMEFSEDQGQEGQNGQEAGQSGTYSFSADFGSVEQSISSNYKKDNTGFELELYQKVGIGTGVFSNNPLLHELPDPISKVTWDNYVTISQADADRLGIKMESGSTYGDITNIVRLTANGTSVEVPALIQPGQAGGTLGLALGYGRKMGGVVAKDLGIDAYPFIRTLAGTQSLSVTEDVALEKTEKTYKLARTQTHQTYMGRDFVVQESTLPEYKKDPYAGRYQPKIATWTQPDHKARPKTITLWKGHEYNNHHWGMIVDMNSCIGCSACTIACNVENNIPVVGKEEVLNRREMHWIRIDRYYSSDAPEEDRRGLENPAENPEVTFQPMMCQHCNNAPCETVCPVAATTHNTEGLNQMAYNRCIGTRYCANNCPYKVRRFNWFKYHDNRQFSKVNLSMNSDLGKMVLNPDVVVRSRGVMEKCSFCIQRIQAGKLEAKKERRRPRDGEIVTACAEACPTNALVFGDMLDPESEITKMLRFEMDDEGNKVAGEERAYHVLEEIGVRPNVFYLTKIRNQEEEV